jgi:hypothetical protein
LGDIGKGKLLGVVTYCKSNIITSSIINKSYLYFDEYCRKNYHKVEYSALSSFFCIDGLITFFYAAHLFCEKYLRGNILPEYGVLSVGLCGSGKPLSLLWYPVVALLRTWRLKESRG